MRVLPLEGNGWYFGDGDLAMPASTLAAWDIGIIEQKLLSPASYKLFETPFVLANGESSHYGLGTFVYDRNGHRELEHSGEVGGYVSENIVFPDDGIAIVVLTNQVAVRRSVHHRQRHRTRTPSCDQLRLRRARHLRAHTQDHPHRPAARQDRPLALHA